MAVLEIRTWGDPVLRQRAREVERVGELHTQLVEDMFETMRAAPGVGLAAPQVGVLERVFVWEVEDSEGCVFNPTITSRSAETVEGEEGCLSIPGLYYPVRRARSVVLEGRDMTGQTLRIEAGGLLARVFQHEIDHLDGVLFLERLADDLRKEALESLRARALGLPETPRPRSAAAGADVVG